MTPSQVLLSIYDDLQSWEPPTKFFLSIAAEPFHVLEILGESGAQMRVVLLWAGDEGVFEGPLEIGVAQNRFEVTVSHAAGLAIVNGANLHRQSPLPNARPPLVSLVDSVRRRIRSLRFAASEDHSGELEYLGCEPVVTPEGIRLAAYTLRFQIHLALGEDPVREALLK